MQEIRPKAGQIWQHFKGNKYRILSITGEVVSKQEQEQIPINVRHSETEQWMIIAYITETNTSCLIPIDENDNSVLVEPHAIYQSIINNEIWARPLDNFLEIVGEQPRFICTSNKSQ